MLGAWLLSLSPSWWLVACWRRCSAETRGSFPIAIAAVGSRLATAASERGERSRGTLDPRSATVTHQRLRAPDAHRGDGDHAAARDES